ncbi:MAG: hypothetical protein II224_01440, partial [Ruminococcus sp.]|nr:hypothetical protein [Ruminococcus sp.]
PPNYCVTPKEKEQAKCPLRNILSKVTAGCETGIAEPPSFSRQLPVRETLKRAGLYSVNYLTILL